MRILWVKAGKLLPVDTGGKIRSYHLLRQLAGRHDLTLLTYYGGRPDPAYDAEIGKHFPGAVAVCTRVPDAGRWHYLRHLACRAPYAVTKFTSPSVRRLVSSWLADRRFDVAVCDFLSASLNFPRRSPTPAVLFQHNVESVLWRRQARHERNPLKRAVFAMESLKMTAYERAEVGRFDHIVAVSETDRAAMSSMTDASRISVAPTGVDVAQYRAAAGSAAAAPVVMFLGSMDWEANVDAVEHFARDVWPAILAAVPDARFRIVGRNPDQRVVQLASPSIEVTGTVPSVVDHLKQAAVVVVPLRIGGGTRLKIFEAMAAGRAVVSTRVGAEGLDVTGGRDIVLADAPSEFAEAVIDLLQSPGRRAALERAAAASAAEHDWPRVAAVFEAILDRAVASQHDEAAVGWPARAGA